MRFVGILMIALSCTQSFAADVLPAIEDMPIMYSNNPKYHDATVSFQKAFFLQSGISAQYNLVRSYAGSESQNVTNKTAYFIDNYTILDSKTVFFAAGVSYTVLVKKQLTKSFNDPLISDWTHTITVNQNSVSTGLRIPF